MGKGWLFLWSVDTARVLTKLPVNVSANVREKMQALASSECLCKILFVVLIIFPRNAYRFFFLKFLNVPLYLDWGDVCIYIQTQEWIGSRIFLLWGNRVSHWATVPLHLDLGLLDSVLVSEVAAPLMISDFQYIIFNTEKGMITIKILSQYPLKILKRNNIKQIHQLCLLYVLSSFNTTFKIWVKGA